ncbi:hypothetical protein KYN89_12810 [Alteriqipengyuania sp. NZ-12B]|uniref:Uncharacterized protein n=1 Tax=Alteriqipengyuania abyssalis TaxID=2860200 RepID=A0ABS7PFT2_9SPHN|nr:hypothetical protein [Alteriqipengyuania abyssalis]MBY8337924.1 hypothetical protein [Alteriqipengyuania abyssalis]
MEFSFAHQGGNCSTCAWIAAEGTIEEGDAAALLAFIEAEQIDYLNLIRINSPGGNLAAALELGQLIRDREFDVIVSETYKSEEEPYGIYDNIELAREGVCASACVFVLMGGVTREMEDGSLIGVHQFAPEADDISQTSATTSETQSLVALLQSYTMSMGVDPVVLALASATKPDEMAWLDRLELESVNLLTYRASFEPSKWSLEPLDDRLIAKTVQEQANGRGLVVILDCGLMHVGFQVRTRRIEEVAKSIRGVALEIDGTSIRYDLQVVDVTSDDGLILVSLAPVHRAISMAEASNNRLVLDVDLPHAFLEEFGGWTYRIPTSNLEEVAPHMRRSCR